MFVAREPGLFGARDGVDIRRRDGGREGHLAGACTRHEPRQQIAGAVFAVRVNDGVETVELLFGFDRVDVGELMNMSVKNHTVSVSQGYRAVAMKNSQLSETVRWLQGPSPCVSRERL